MCNAVLFDLDQYCDRMCVKFENKGRTMNTRCTLLFLMTVLSSMTRAMILNEAWPATSITGNVFIVPRELSRIENGDDQNWIIKELRNVTFIDDAQVSVKQGDYVVAVLAADRNNGDEKKDITHLTQQVQK
jgi:hypothetical protein